MTEIEHFVPKFIIDNFCNNKKKACVVYNETRNPNITRLNIKFTYKASKSLFQAKYLHEHWSRKSNQIINFNVLENNLGKLESKWSRSIQKIIKNKDLSKNDYENIIEFLANSYIRNPNRLRNSLNSKNQFETQFKIQIFLNRIVGFTNRFEELTSVPYNVISNSLYFERLKDLSEYGIIPYHTEILKRCKQSGATITILEVPKSLDGFILTNDPVLRNNPILKTSHLSNSLINSSDLNFIMPIAPHYAIMLELNNPSKTIQLKKTNILKNDLKLLNVSFIRNHTTKIIVQNDIQKHTLTKYLNKTYC